MKKILEPEMNDSGVYDFALGFVWKKIGKQWWRSNWTEIWNHYCVTTQRRRLRALHGSKSRHYVQFCRGAYVCVQRYVFIRIIAKKKDNYTKKDKRTMTIYYVSFLETILKTQKNISKLEIVSKRRNIEKRKRKRERDRSIQQ